MDKKQGTSSFEEQRCGADRKEACKVGGWSQTAKK